jgi:Protein of unknown function (DUF664)
MTSTDAITMTETGERAELLAALAQSRYFLRNATRDVTEEQARQPTIVSELTVGRQIKHVSLTEQAWADFVVDGPSAIQSGGEDVYAALADRYRMGDDETLAGLLANYAAIAARTDELVASLPSLAVDQPLPEAAPWFQPGGRWSARRVVLYLIAETAQHAGHADIVREALDGAQTTG